MNSRKQSYVIYALLFIAVVALLVYSFNSQENSDTVLSINELAAQIQAGKVEKIVEDDGFLKITLADGSLKESTKEPVATLVEQLVQLGVTPQQMSAENVKIEIKPPADGQAFFPLLATFFPCCCWEAPSSLSSVRHKAAITPPCPLANPARACSAATSPLSHFEDVAGIEESKEELLEIVEFLQEPQKFIALGARIPKGVLLVGPPGTGKTLLAKAVSGEAGVPFFSISGSEFVEMFVGVGASRVRDLFEQAKRQSPCIVFVDEIDAVGRHRGAGLGGSHDEREQTLNQLLVEMDGFGTDTNVIIMAATNRPDILDPALLRPGRFDRRVVLDRPDMVGREAILKVHVRGKPLSPDVDLNVLARGTPGFVGADMENLVNEAAILSARRDKKVIGQSEFEESVERVIAGPERKSRLISGEERVIIAYHEAGHAVVMHTLPEADPVQKITIIGRGMAAGYTLALPIEDRVLQSKKKMVAEMIGLMGGRAAEQLVFDDYTSGASNDISV